MLTPRDVWVYMFAQAMFAEQPPSILEFFQHYKTICEKLGMKPIGATEARELVDNDIKQIQDAIKAVFGTYE